MTIQEILDELFISEDMRQYMRIHADQLTKYQRIQMITGAPITLQRKLAILECLASEENLKAELATEEDAYWRERMEEDSYQTTYQNLKRALEELESSDGGVFLVKMCRCDMEDIEIEAVAPAFSIEQAMTAMDWFCEDDGYCYYKTIEKWEPDQDGKLIETWRYYVFGHEILYCRYEQPGLNGQMCEPNAMFLNLPVPFQAGDLIEVTYLPWEVKRHALVVDIGDNDDCCCVQAVHVTKDGYLKQGALKHGEIFAPLAWFVTSPLYSVKRYDGELSEREAVLTRIHTYFEENTDAKKYMEYINFPEKVPVEKITKCMLKMLVWKAKKYWEKIDGENDRK